MSAALKQAAQLAQALREIKAVAWIPDLVYEKARLALEQFEAEPQQKPAGYVTAIEEGKVLMLPRPSLNTDSLVPVYARPQQEPDKLDAERWRFAMDWGQKDFAVCMRVGKTGVCWEPIKTDGPIDEAIRKAQP